jgi:TPP-dependent pyruvate/acetoin dehydrogenase alpha subunit
MTQNNHKPAPPDEGFSLISRQKLLTLYSAMLRCRSISERSMAPTKSGNSVVGHEAVAVGAAIDLHPHDTVAAARWPQSALKEINPSVSIAPSISFASRSALREKGGRGITVLFASGKEKSQSSWMSALTFAGGHNLPFLFVSLSGPNASEEIAWAEALSMKGKKYSLPLIAVDGYDVVAVYRVASEAIAHARKGHGPTLIDCRLASFGDPLKNMQKYLLDKGLELPAQ